VLDRKRNAHHWHYCNSASNYATSGVSSCAQAGERPKKTIVAVVLPPENAVLFTPAPNYALSDNKLPNSYVVGTLRVP
jgi:hypothetical protein